MKRAPYKRIDKSSWGMRWPFSSGKKEHLEDPEGAVGTAIEPSVEDLENGMSGVNEIGVIHTGLGGGTVIYSHGLTSKAANYLLSKYGKNELPEKVVPRWYIFVSLLWEPMPVMIWIAIIIEAILGKVMDMSILLGIQMTNASIAFYETTQSGNAVAALKASLRPEATVKRDGIWQSIDAAFLVPGDLVLLSTGSAVPADCRINDGNIELDQSALTGESLPAAKFAGDNCMMGSTVARGEVEATVESTGINTFFGKTASLLQVRKKQPNLQTRLPSLICINFSIE
jgi:H+-transporting ATPase